MTEQDARWQALVERLKQANTLPAEVTGLVRAINGQPDRAIGCDECRAELPAYVEAETGGLPIGQKYPHIKHHLKGCAECEAEYVAILHLALADETATAPARATMPLPDLSFLPSLKLADYVRVLTEEIVAAIAPGLTEELHAIADLFFERVAELGRQFQFGPGMAPALGFGAGETPEALKLLAATYAATAALTADHPANELETQARTGQLASLLQSEAQQAARQVRLSSSQAKRFAAAYSRLAARDSRTLQQLAR